MSTLFQIDSADPMPLYAQLERAIRLAVATGRVAVGDQLPTVRQLAVDLRINANTVAKVYAELERTGLVETRRGVGTFVRTPGDDAAVTVNRQQELHFLIDRFLAEAARLGFTPGDVLLALQNR
jgi:GntR family transcriptional regulator